jgi:hypothetical protein
MKKAKEFQLGICIDTHVFTRFKKYYNQLTIENDFLIIMKFNF